jgi:hypothetical protein
MKKIFLYIFLLLSFLTQAQVISGPMVGHTELRTSNIWMHFSNDIKSAYLVFYKNGTTQNTTSYFKINDGLFKTASALLYNLEPATT